MPTGKFKIETKPTRFFNQSFFLSKGDGLFHVVPVDGAVRVLRVAVGQ